MQFIGKIPPPDMGNSPQNPNQKRPAPAWVMATIIVISLAEMAGLAYWIFF